MPQWSNYKPTCLEGSCLQLLGNHEERQFSFLTFLVYSIQKCINQINHLLKENINNNRSVSVYLGSFTDYKLRTRVIRGLGYLVCFPQTPIKTFLAPLKHILWVVILQFSNHFNRYLALNLMSRKPEKCEEVGTYYLFQRQVIWSMQFLSNDSE